MRRTHGFTIIELLVVIGIIVLLIGILLPITIAAIGKGETTRMRADLVTIGTALDAYEQDNGRYPRVTTPGTGFAVLGRALIGPGPAFGADTEPAINVPEDTAITVFDPGTVARDGTGLDRVFVAVTTDAD
ncbi:MAG: prepilin-type N-terminal cleavage/methylation domain-containing protein, partial [Planctomycetota bacterium]